MKVIYNNRTGCFKICEDKTKKTDDILGDSLTPPPPTPTITPKNNNGTPINGIFYNIDNIPQMKLPNLNLPKDDLSIYKCGNLNKCKADFFVGGFTVPSPWLNPPELQQYESQNQFPSMTAKGANGALVFGGATANPNDWISLFNGLTTIKGATNFLQNYGLDPMLSENTRYVDWYSIMIDMESTKGDPNSITGLSPTTIKGAISNIYSALKGLRDSDPFEPLPYKLYLVVNPKDNKYYLDKWDVDGIISMNYGESEPKEYLNDYKNLVENSVNYIIPGINPQNDKAVNPNQYTPAGSVSTYLDLGYNIGHGVFLWASNWVCEYCKSDMLVKYIDNFNASTRSNEICNITSNGPGKICYKKTDPKGAAWKPTYSTCKGCITKSDCGGTDECYNIRDENRECIACSSKGTCTTSPTSSGTCNKYITNANCLAFGCTWKGDCSGVLCPAIGSTDKCADGNTPCCDAQGILCFCNKGMCP